MESCLDDPLWCLQLLGVTHDEVKAAYLDSGYVRIGFSGGSTSAVMLLLALLAYDRRLPDDWVTVFANTGCEDVRTVDFVQRCSREWNTPITCVEYRREPNGAAVAAGVAEYLRHWAEVPLQQVAMKGEPFEEWLTEWYETGGREKSRYLPAAWQRKCSSRMKHRTAHGYCATREPEADWTVLLGIRADEPTRVAAAHGRRMDGHWSATPLATLGITKADVNRFWSAHAQRYGWRLALDGASGNCGLCPIKTKGAKIYQLREFPDAPGNAFFLRMEAKYGRKWRSDYSTEQIRILAQMQLPLPGALGLADDDVWENPRACECGD